MRAARLLLPALACVLAACVSGPPGGLAGDPWSPPVDATYLLPFAGGTTRLCVQGGPGPFSHEGSQRYAIDFAMPVGTPVLAARAGRVVAVKEDSDSGGSGREHAEEGNYVRVEHDDGTRAVYLHLAKDGAHVVAGQRVERGQTIASSGNTGWSAMPHLHFQVDAKDPESGRWSSIPVRFADVKADGVPRMLLWYTSGNAAAR